MEREQDKYEKLKNPEEFNVIPSDVFLHLAHFWQAICLLLTHFPGFHGTLKSSKILM